MKKSSFRKSLAVGLFGIVCAALNTGCNTADIGFGFMAGLGAIPANLIGNFITANFLGDIPQ